MLYLRYCLCMMNSYKQAAFRFLLNMNFKMRKGTIKYFEDDLLSKDGKIYFGSQENDKIEYKLSLQLSGESISKSYLKTISGFANNKGGCYVFWHRSHYQ